MAQQSTTGRQTSVVRALRILDHLAHQEKPLSLTRLADALSIPKSTAHSILRDLVNEGFVELGEPPAYSIGLKAFEVGSAHLRTIGTVGVIAGELGRLTSLLRVTSHYAVLDGTDVVYLCKEDPPGLGVQLASSIGARLPAQVTAVGKAALAWLEADRITGHTELTTASARTALDLELSRVRDRGYATDDGVAASGIQCVAAPIFDVSGPKGAVGVSYVRDGATQPLDTLVSTVREAAMRASSLLGGGLQL